MDIGIDVSDVISDLNNFADTLGDLADALTTREFYGMPIGAPGDLLGDVAPMVSLFNPALGAGLAVTASVFEAAGDGKITTDEVMDIGRSVMESQGLGYLGGYGLEASFGIKTLAEKQSVNIMEKLINGESVSQSDVDFLGELISLLNLETVKQSGRSGSKGGASGAGEAGGEGGADAAGESIFQVIASVFGEKMKKALGEMLDLADQIKGASKEDVAELTPGFTAAAQQFSFLSQSFNTGINALGEGLKSAARKQ